MSNEQATHESPSELRERYVEGEMSESEFERRMDYALEAAPDLGSEPMGSIENIGLVKRLCAAFQMPILLVLGYGLRRKGKEFSYDWSKHHVISKDTDPDAGDHPAESAGVLSTFIWVVSGYAWLAAFHYASLYNSLGALVFTTIALFAATYAGMPSVKHTDVGIGTHVIDP